MFAATTLGLVVYLSQAPAQSEGATSEVSRRIIERTDITGSDEELRLMLVEFPPGYSNAAHRHPVAWLCYVIEGTAESQYEGEALNLIRKGESFQDEANKTHVVFRNVSETDALRFICAAKIRKDQEYLLPQ
jgi:quercetin dioxygenase-like cupin family protein